MRPSPGSGFRWVDLSAGPALQCEPLLQFAEHLFTTRSWLLGSSAVDPDEGWYQVAAAAAVPPDRLMRVRQVHGASVVVARGGRRDASLCDADVVVTRDRSIAIAIQTADCVPLLIADPATGSVAAAHAGWRGLAAQVPHVVVNALEREFGARRDDLVIAIGPAISGPRYEVGVDVWNRFASGGFPKEHLASWFLEGHRPEHWQFDGTRSARDQLIEAGVRADQIFVSGLCTATEREWLCSYRRDGRNAGRMAAVIKLR